MRKENVSYQDKINELRLDITHPNSKNKVFILLEGESDVLLFRKLYANPRIKSEFLAGGKLFLEQGLTTLNPYSKRVIGVRDADFLHLENKKPTLPNLFFTDFHDMEMLLIASNPTFSAVMHEFCNLPKSEHEMIRKKLLESLQFVSYLRWYNDQTQAEFSFEGLGFGYIFQATNYTIDNRKYVEKLVAKSKNAVSKEVTEIIENVAKLIGNHDNLQLCNGHDFMDLLALFLNTHNKEGLTAKRISSHFRIAYSFAEFQQSNLHREIQVWAVKNGIMIDFHN